MAPWVRNIWSINNLLILREARSCSSRSSLMQRRGRGGAAWLERGRTFDEHPAGCSSISPKRLAAVQRQPLAYVAALLNSMPTNGSSPTTRASCPGGIVYESPFVMVIRAPSVIHVSSFPETQ